MDIEAALNSLQSRIRDSEQRERIKQLAERIETAFEKTRSQGVKKELELDWAALKAQFDTVLGEVQKETGLY